MDKWNIWIFRPDRCGNGVQPAGLYHSSGQSYHDWKRDQETLYDYKVRKLIQKIEAKPEHQVYDYWR